ncbi:MULTISPECIES: lantibiotic dehydratase [unclassified Streptomyces]|uniref:lantibiotic dehydratase n=1 Tax=unclassified Streptomyces TaxID=2593676 RepID=UPI000DB978AB|nr:MULTISPECIES: lantibiotic dehydratase [unclassified Streptomyces]MYT68320.1 lantibiotic dehydratase [Streptomyces sp. SID8367]RAJ76956.1 thiopeptide-type bacteriocin biosynthesis protein [Streptomyces sp. PsTaAH-137]
MGDVTYRWTRAAVLRATTAPNPADRLETSDLNSPATTRMWLAQLFARPDVRNAFFAASPVLTQAVESIVAGTQTQPRQIRRAALSVTSYLLRWRHRPTPFALFSGVATVTAGARPTVRFGDAHPVSLRADGEWISDIVRALEDDPAVLAELSLVANNGAHTRGKRIAAPGVPADGHDLLMAPDEMSLRRTRPVEAALSAAATPITYRALRDHLTGLFPSGAGGKIDGVLRELVAHNLLITSLRPPMTVLDPLKHVCGELDRIEHPLGEELGDLHAALVGHSDTAAATDLRTLTRRMHQQSAIAPMPLVVDTALDCDVQIPGAVIAEAERAVAVLHQVSPLPHGHDQWRDWHWRFRERYGPGAMVPVLDLVKDSGLGWPAQYIGSERRKPPTPVTDRDRLLLRMVQRAASDGRTELILDDAAVTELAQAAGDDKTYSDRSELAVEIHAPSTRALADGDFRLEVVGVPRPGTSMLGRSAHVLPAAMRRQISQSLRTRPRAITAQLSFGPRRRRNENVARTGRLLTYVIPLGEHPPDSGPTIPLDDLAVTASATHLFLVQRSTGRPIDARIPHALEAGIQTPPLARLLAEISGGRRAAYGEFDFGAASRLPYLPRVRYGRTILSAARWLLATSDLPGPSATQEQWDEQFTLWRHSLHVPDRVSMSEYDQRLTLRLDQTAHRCLLRAALNRLGEVELRETPDADAYGWIGRAHHIALAFHRTTPAPAKDPRPPARTAPPPPIQLPGTGNMVRAHLHGHPHRFDEILTDWLPALLDPLGDDGRESWFTRYRDLSRPDTGQYLDLSLSTPTDDWSLISLEVNRWARDLHDAGLLSRLTFESYQPQPGRYGASPAAAEAVRAVFSADSRLAIEQIRYADRHGIDLTVLTAVSLIDLSTGLLGATKAGLAWLLEHAPAKGRPDRELRRQAIQLYDRHHLPGTDALIEAGEARAKAVAVYRQALLAEARSPSSLLRTLLHQHHVRALGVDTTKETAVLHLARTVALRHLPRKAAR